MNKKTNVAVIVGPTASGKTALSIALAKHYQTEIVSADSMQIYKGMDIATAKPTTEEMMGIKHHLIDFLNCEKSFSVAEYVQLAHKEIKKISDMGKLPIVVGGTGLYIDSLINDIDFSDIPSDEKYRNELYQFVKEQGKDALLKKLAEIDSYTAKKLHPNNVSRIIRALEVYKVTGKTMSEQQIASRQRESRYNPCFIGLSFKDREKLYERINHRVDIMIENGLLFEAEAFIKNGKMLSTAAQAIGYKELEPYFNDEICLEEAMENLKRETRRYAKRQLTWFRRNEQINWLYRDDEVKEDNLIKNSVNIIDFSFDI